VYRRFIDGYARIAAPLVKKLKDLPEGAGAKGSKHPIELDDQDLVAFQTLLSLRAY